PDTHSVLKCTLAKPSTSHTSRDRPIWLTFAVVPQLSNDASRRGCCGLLWSGPLPFTARAAGNDGDAGVFTAAPARIRGIRAIQGAHRPLVAQEYKAKVCRCFDSSAGTSPWVGKSPKSSTAQT